MNKVTTGVAVLAALGLGFGGGYWYATTRQHLPLTAQVSQSDETRVLYYRNPMNPAITSPVPMQDEMGMDYIPVYAEGGKRQAREVLYYRNPMNPAVTSPMPMQDEMGMDYIPVYADGHAGDGADPVGTVTIDPVVVQNIGVRTAVAEQRAIARRVHAVGRVALNEERLARLHPKTSGWIESLLIDETGKQVSNDTILLDFYAPDLVAAQREYLVALKSWETVRATANAAMKKSAETVLDSARERLELFDVPAHQIRELEQSRTPKRHLHIHSPFTGRVMHIGAREGQYVTPKDELYLIADLSRVWVFVEVYEDDLPWIKEGDNAEMRVRAAPGRTFNGEVTFIYPTLESTTRTVRVRLEFDNPDLTLKPGMFANAVLHVNPQAQAVVVPSEAIVRSGQREQLFVMTAPGKFVPRDVTIGLSAAGMTQIVAGLAPGETVVTSSQFLIDSESKLREATAKMMEAMAMESPATPMPMADMDMPGMDMSDFDMEDMTMDDLTMDDMDMEE